MWGGWNEGHLFCLLAAAGSEEAIPATKSTGEEMSEAAKEELGKIAKEMGLPLWALYCIGIGK